MKVAFVITALTTGGAQMMLYKLLLHSSDLRNGYVISLRSGGEFEDRIRALGVDVQCLGMQPGRFSPRAAWRLVQLLRSKKADVVSSWLYHADLLAGIAGRMAGTPVIWNIRNSNVDPSKRTTRAVVSICAGLSRVIPKRIISCSLAAQDIHIRLGYRSDRFTIIPNGFDLRAFYPSLDARKSVRLELGIPQDAPLVGLIGRFDPQKNHAGFLEAARAVHDLHNDVRFLLVGEGVSRSNDYLSSVVERYGLEGSVHMLGRRDDMPRIMGSLDVLVLSSSYGEAFPNVLGEAMACGVPCVVTDVGDSALIVGDTGVVVEPNNMASLAQGVHRLLLLSPDQRLSVGTLARDRVTRLFEIGRVVGRYESLFQEVAQSAALST